MWKYRCKSEIKSKRHEKSSQFFTKISYTIEFLIALISGIIVILSGYKVSELPNRMELITLMLSSTSFILQMLLSITNIKTKIIKHSSLDSNFNFLYREIEKMMHLYTTEIEFEIITLIAGDIITMFEFEEDHIPNFISKDIKNFKKSPPIIPQSKIDLLQEVEENVDEDFLFFDTTSYVIHDKIIQNNVGFFRADTDGCMINVCNNFANLANMKKKCIIYPSGMGWITNMDRQDYLYIIYTWKKSIQNMDMFLDKFKFIDHRGNISYIIIEFHPNFSRFNILIEFEGIIVRVSENDWNQMNKNNLKISTESVLIAAE